MNEIARKLSPIQAAILLLISLLLPACNRQTEALSEAKRHEEVREEVHRITATTPQSKAITLTQQFVCQIHSQRHIEIRALERGYLEAVEIKEGQRVKAGDPMFKVIPILYKTKLEAENADARYAELQYNNAKKLSERKVVSENEVALKKAKLAEAEADAQMATAVLDFATVKAPYDGIIDRLHEQQGSLVEKGTILTTLSDNSVMWVYFNVPERIYLESMVNAVENKDLQVKLKLADGSIFQHDGKITTIEADFDNESGNIPFRADFPNPDGLLRNGQTGTVIVGRVVKGAIVIPQRATFEVVDKRFVYVVDKDHVAHQREIVVQNELDDLFVIKSGLAVDDRIILEGARQVHDGEKVEYEYRPAKQVDERLKYHAE